MNLTFTLWATPALKRTAFALLFLTTAFIVKAQTKTWVGANNGNWNTASNWSPSTIPSATDNIVLNNSTNVVMNTTATVASITIASSANNSTTTLSFSSGSQLTVSGAVRIGSTGNRKGAIVMTNGGNLKAGSIVDQGANLGNAVLTPGTGATGGTIELTSTNTLPANSNLNTFNNLVITGATTTTATPVIINNDLTGTGALTQGSGLIAVGGNWNRASTASFTASAAGVTLTGSNKTISGSSGLTFTTLTVNGSYTNNQTGTNLLTVSTSLVGTGNLTQAAGANLNISGTSSLASLVATATGNSVNYNGSSAQNILAASYYNLNFNGGGAKALDGTAHVINNATFTSGILTTTASKLLIFDNSATVTGASNASFINGPVQKTGTNAFTFPVGKNGKYVPISISEPSDVNDAFTAEYIPQSGAALGPISSSAQSRNLEAVSHCEYWVLDRTVGTSAVDVTLSWGPDNACSGPGYIKNPFFLVVAHFGGGEWNDFSEGTNNVITGTATGGTVTWKGVSTFSPFTIGSTNASEATLPVTFVSLTGKKVEGGTQLTWNVGGEVNVKEYQVERSATGNSGFIKVGTVPATGNNSYSFTDAVSNGVVFYRIKNVDNDGHFKYSTILQFRNGSGAVLFRVVPTLVTSNTVVQHATSKGLTSIILSTVDGKVVRSLRPAAGTEQTTIDMSNLRPGLYLLKWSDASGSVKTAKVIKQ